MSERERWIVYPLLFLALGAALRDKFLQHVKTKELECQRLIVQQLQCDELTVADPTKSNRIVAKLTSGEPARGDGNRFGVLALFDSEGEELCGVTNNVLQVKQIGCKVAASERFEVYDPSNPRRALAVLAAGQVRASNQEPRWLGHLLLTDSRGEKHFSLANDVLQMSVIVCRNLFCEGVGVVDPDDRRNLLAALGSGFVESDGERRRVGILELNKLPLVAVRGTPSEEPLQSPTAPPDPASDDKDAEPAGDVEVPDVGQTAPPAPEDVRDEIEAARNGNDEMPADVEGADSAENESPPTAQVE